MVKCLFWLDEEAIISSHRWMRRVENSENLVAKLKDQSRCLTLLYLDLPISTAISLFWSMCTFSWVNEHGKVSSGWRLGIELPMTLALIGNLVPLRVEV